MRMSNVQIQMSNQCQMTNTKLYIYLAFKHWDLICHLDLDIWNSTINDQCQSSPTGESANWRDQNDQSNPNVSIPTIR